MNSLELHNEIESIVKESGTDYIDAVVHYCSVNNLEIETVALILMNDSNIIEKLLKDAENLHFVKKINRLPI